MRRAQVFLVIAALLATPLALLARAEACNSAACTMMCCLPHGAHSHPGQPMACHCPSKSGKHLPEFGLIAPIAPTAPEAFATVAAPASSRTAVPLSSLSLTQGFSAAPFNPPRA